MRLRLPVLLLAAVTVSACLKGLDLPDGRFGTITATSFDDGTGHNVLSPEAAFYDKTELDFVPFTNDTCITLPFSAQGGTVSSGYYYLDAGVNLPVTVSGNLGSLPRYRLGSVVYYGAGASQIDYTPGDTLTVTIPGATPGYPASAISVRTSESFTHDTIVVPAADQPLPITWTTTPVPGSQMIVSLRYGNGTLNQANEQLYCSFIDDGAASIPATYLEGWRLSVDSLRSTRLSRQRSRRVDVDARTRLSIVSSFTRPLLELH